MNLHTTQLKKLRAIDIASNVSPRLVKFISFLKLQALKLQVHMINIITGYKVNGINWYGSLKINIKSYFNVAHTKSTMINTSQLLILCIVTGAQFHCVQ